jgi:hypothetical protein
MSEREETIKEILAIAKEQQDKNQDCPNLRIFIEKIKGLSHVDKAI